MENTKILFKDVLLIGGGHKAHKGWLLVSGGVIENYGAGEPAQVLQQCAERVVNGDGNALLPGFIDLHTHGAVGHEFMEPDPQTWQMLSRYYASHGVTGLLASTWTAGENAIQKVLSVAQNFMGHEEGSRVLGVHLEGPFLSRARAGAQDPGLIRIARRNEVIPYLESGLVRLIALAPEIEENQWLIEECKNRGITVSAGHTDATYEEMLKAVDKGVTQVTHCFNAMRPLNHREPGTVGAALTLPQVRCELIADNIHIHPAVMKLLLAAKGLDGIILITDSIMGAGMPDGEILLEGQKAVLKNGEARLLDGTLAGSLLSMENALKNFVQATGVSIDQAWVCSSLNAARALHINDRKGSLGIGKDADLVMLDDQYRVQMTMIEGKIVYQAGE